MQKRLLKILSVLLSVVIIIVSITFIKRDKPVNQKTEITEDTATNSTEEKSTQITTTEPTTESTTETTTETTTESTTVYIEPPVSATSPELQELVNSVAEKYGAVGIQVATIKDGKVTSTAEYGWAEIDTKKMETDTKIRIASLSKTVVGMVVMKLVDEGKIDMDKDISEYLGVTVRNPEFPDIPITLRMILTHTSGLYDGEYKESLEELQEYLLTPEAYKEKPGEIYRYNNFAFGVAGTICECVTGKSLNNLAKQYFFNPMGISASYLAGQLDVNKIATVYDGKGEVGISAEKLARAKTDRNKIGRFMMLYSGGLTTSAYDLAKLLTVLVNDGAYKGKQLLSKESVALMQTQQLQYNSQQCMVVKKKTGLYNQDYLYYHTGSAYGVYSLYTYNPEEKTGVVVITTGAQSTRDKYGIYAVCGDITNEIYAKNLL